MGGTVITRSFYTLDANGNVLTEADGSLAAQFGRPDGLVSSNGTWTGTFASINEVSPNDATFLASPTSPTTTNFYEVSLSDAELPGDLTGLVLRYRYAKSGNNSGKTTNLVVEIRQGSTAIASQTNTNIPGVDGSGWQQGTLTLSLAQASSITNYAELRIRFRPSSSGGGQGRAAQISWAELQLPGAGSQSSLLTNTYDRLNRLTSVMEQSVARSYTYDPVGNRLMKVDGGTTTYTYDRADRMTAAGAAAVTVDANGNLIARGADSFGFDQANRLTSATVGGTTETYTYDGNGTRVSRQVGAGTPTFYRSDTTGPLAITLDDGGRKYVYGQSLAYAVTGSTLEIYHGDRLGSIRALTNAAGNVSATYDTDEWGRSTGGSGVSTQPYGFTGEPRDATGLTYLRTRYYSPELGRFLSRDTWPGVPTLPQTQNRYSYVANNPTTASDPSGRLIETILDIAFIVYDLGALVFGPEKERGTNLFALGADLAGAAVPFVTGGGAAVRVGVKGADNIDDAVGGARWIDDAAAACSFTGETLVATPGGAVPISSIEVGDVVLAWDELQGALVERVVEAVLPHRDDEIAEVAIDGQLVTTTPDHPFYTVGRGWVEARDLWPGAEVRTTTGKAQVSSVWSRPFSGTLWDLTVQGAHTFYVGPGRWLVHNCPAARGFDSRAQVSEILAQKKAGITRAPLPRDPRTGTPSGT